MATPNTRDDNRKGETKTILYYVYVWLQSE